MNLNILKYFYCCFSGEKTCQAPCIAILEVPHQGKSCIGGLYQNGNGKE